MCVRYNIYIDIIMCILCVFMCVYIYIRIYIYIHIIIYIYTYIHVFHCNQCSRYCHMLLCVAVAICSLFPVPNESWQRAEHLTATGHSETQIQTLTLSLGRSEEMARALKQMLATCVQHTLIVFGVSVV